MKKDRKNKEIELLKSNLESKQSIFISKYQGLDVEKFSLLRKEIRDSGGQLKVFKNTLSKIAFRQTHLEPLSEYLNESNFIVFTDDPHACSKVLSEFAQKNPENIEIKAGYYQAVLDKKAIIALAALPFKDVLIGRFISVIRSPEIRMVFALKMPILRLIRTLRAVEEARKTAV